MAIGKKTMKLIESKFYNYEKIKTAVAEARAEQDSKGGITGGGNGHSRISDPTASIAVKHATPISYVTIKSGLYDIRVYQPEKWLKIIDWTYKLYGDRLEAVAARRRYVLQESTSFIADNMGVGRSTCYEWRESFIMQTALLAAAEGLIDPGTALE